MEIMETSGTVEWREGDDFFLIPWIQLILLYKDCHPPT